MYYTHLLNPDPIGIPPSNSGFYMNPPYNAGPSTQDEYKGLSLGARFLHLWGNTDPKLLNFMLVLV